jgi:glutaminyl-tRNA synthetase
LSPEQLVCLKYSCVVEHVETVKKADGSIDHVKVKAHKSYDKKLKGYIHWVSKGRSIDVELRLFNRLFTIVDIKKAEDKWLDYVNPESRIVKSNAKMWDLHKDCPVYTRF